MCTAKCDWGLFRGCESPTVTVRALGGDPGVSIPYTPWLCGQDVHLVFKAQRVTSKTNLCIGLILAAGVHTLAPCLCNL